MLKTVETISLLRKAIHAAIPEVWIEERIFMSYRVPFFNRVLLENSVWGTLGDFSLEDKKEQEAVIYYYPFDWDKFSSKSFKNFY